MAIAALLKLEDTNNLDLHHLGSVMCTIRRGSGVNNSDYTQSRSVKLT